MSRRKKTDAEFKKQVFDLVGDEYTFLDKYVTNKTKLRVKHNKCGHIYEVKPNTFLTGSRCSYCSINTGKTNAQFKQEVFGLVGNEYTFLDTYVNAKTKLKVKHNKCGYVYLVSPHNFLQGCRCPRCANVEVALHNTKTPEIFEKEVFDLVGDEYTFLDKYVNTKTKLKVRHNKCGHIYEVLPSNFLHGFRCPYCAVTQERKTDTQFKQEVHDLVGDEYTFLGAYVTSKTKIKVMHNNCGNVYKVRPTDFISHHARCPYCNMPKTEKIIAKILDTLNINYEIQKTFEDLKDKSDLSYDFYIPDQSILIEYQGIQHYKPLDLYGGKDAFEIQRKHDSIKSDYAKSHHYNLIAVPYTEDTFSKIKKYLIKHGLSK